MRQALYCLHLAFVTLAALVLGTCLLGFKLIEAAWDALRLSVENWRQMRETARAVRDGEQPE